jgi:hypothetical protein
MDQSRNSIESYIALHFWRNFRAIVNNNNNNNNNNKDKWATGEGRLNLLN